MKFTIQFVIVLALSILFSGCSYLSSDKDAYKESRSARPLEAPPELVLPQSDKHYQIPGQGVRVLKTAQVEQVQTSSTQSNQQDKKTSITSSAKSGYFSKDGKQWIHINASVNDIWNPLVSFWQEQNFKLEKKDKALGVIQSSWSNKESREQPEGMKSLFKKFGGLFTGKERERYLVTVSESGGGTDVYLSHEYQERNMDEVDSHFAGDSWENGPADSDKVEEILQSLYQELSANY